MSTKSSRMRSLALVALGAVTLPLGLAACGDAGSAQSGGPGHKPTVVVAALQAAAKYYQEEMDGAKAFGVEDGNVNLTVTAPPSYDSGVAQKQIRDLLATGPDAIGITPQPPDLWGRTMKDAVSRLDGKVISFSERTASTENGAKDAAVKTTVGYNDRGQARTLLEQTIKVGNIPASSTGKVLLAGCTADQTGTVALRLQGFQDAVKELLPQAQVVTLVSAPDVKENQDRWSSALTAHPDAVLAAGTCEPDGQSLYRLKKERGYNFALGAMELTPESISGLRDGLTTAVQSANTWLMGYTTARMLTMAARGEKLPAGFVATGGTLFTKDNVNDTEVRETDPAKFYKPLVDKLFANGMPKAAPVADAWN
ncbi:sugar ABC transporter substrate-binding protein [Amycolatopsis pithecellobii]|uniref:Substrate-binding domain-containing protein n=1 Tax=Amycolatopsis pithecellobii TaxID=664692 RepID=A0A6N7YYU3_9PSEU|nr:sugar ABC transporter substrate-binding protein [Amycolatopsis pithecellobii]MTD52611.1 substrate-binding domain-containing protein [Amycolatopsis pithecellobii]